MWTRNQGQTADEILQNKFTAYVARAVQRRKKDYLKKLKNYQDHVCTLDEAEIAESAWIENEAAEKLPILMRIQNEALLDAVLMLSEREQYILLSCALKEKSFTELSQELELSYKGVAAIYYRTIQKIKKRMGGEDV